MKYSIIISVFFVPAALAYPLSIPSILLRTTPVATDIFKSSTSLKPGALKFGGKPDTETVTPDPAPHNKGPSSKPDDAAVTVAVNPSKPVKIEKGGDLPGTVTATKERTGNNDVVVATGPSKKTGALDKSKGGDTPFTFGKEETVTVATGPSKTGAKIDKSGAGDTVFSVGNTEGVTVATSPDKGGKVDKSAGGNTVSPNGKPEKEVTVNAGADKPAAQGKIQP